MKALFLIGPSGSGKSTLSAHLYNIYKKIFGIQSATMINLDPANNKTDNINININQLITLQDIMQQYQLGPNGAMLYSIQFLSENLQWLLNKLNLITNKNKQQQHLFIFDLPGQIQLYIHTNSLRKIIDNILKQTNATGCILQLFDCTYIQNLQDFISICMMSLTTMINLQMPHINLLNKIDLLKSTQNKVNRGLINQYFNVSSMAEIVQQLSHTVKSSQKQTQQQAIKHLQNVAQIIDTYNQVSFIPCSIYKTNLLTNLLYELEKVFGTINVSLSNQNFYQIVKDYDMFSHQRAITQLQDQLNAQEEQQMQKMDTDINKDMKNQKI